MLTRRAYPRKTHDVSATYYCVIYRLHAHRKKVKKIISSYLEHQIFNIKEDSRSQSHKESLLLLVISRS